MKFFQYWKCFKFLIIKNVLKNQMTIYFSLSWFSVIHMQGCRGKYLLSDNIDISLHWVFRLISVLSAPRDIFRDPTFFLCLKGSICLRITNKFSHPTRMIVFSKVNVLKRHSRSNTWRVSFLIFLKSRANKAHSSLKGLKLI